MPDRLDPQQLRAPIRSEEGRQLLVAYLHMLSSRIRVVAELQADFPGISYLDTVVNLHVFCFAESGTRAQNLVDSLGAPRRTIRNSIDRLVGFGMICREGRLYFPTEMTGALANRMLAEVFSNIALVCDAAATHRKNHGRYTP